MKKPFLLLLCLAPLWLRGADVWVEAESFRDKGGWVLDQQFMDLMGSSYLMAHGMGQPVADARTTVRFDRGGTYHVYVRTYNWTSPWHDGEGPGAFTLSVNGKRTGGKLGTTGQAWQWQPAGRVRVRAGEATLALHDLTGFASVQWYSVEEPRPCRFPPFRYGADFNAGNARRVTMGEWTWETGMGRDQVAEAERIRDYGLLVVYSNWSFLKNELKDDAFACRRLGWVAYVAGKRESRRLLGDYVLKQDDLCKHVFHEDGSFATTWSIDLHHPDSANAAQFPTGSFISVDRHIPIHPYAVPYRCLYSRNTDNLFMAGRNISVTHVALGTVRVMRTTGMMGEVVGMAASLCRRYGITPREVYQHHLPELQALMRQGTGRQGLPNNQRYNEGSTLGEVGEE